jgi:hypothetical protein
LHDDGKPLPLRRASPGIASLTIRFFALLMAAVLLLALIWSR